ncbi:MAG: hypothetical protein HKP61_09050 [Dactylosporangium sp.]|nr:hypothetical protein [Dactylosporangium sp.]NNJ61078.1 hypothetical protein [Dactylosporangium sp.]
MLVAVTLLGLAVVLVTVLRGRDGAEEPLVDPCVVGNWTVQNMTMAIETDAFGKIRFVSLGEIGKIEYGADGTAVHAYGDEARLSAEVTVSAVSQQAILTITGVDRYDYRTSDSTMVFSSLRDDRTTTLTIDGIGVSSDIDINMGLEPARFSCAGDSLTTFTENYRAEAHRDS